MPNKQYSCWVIDESNEADHTSTKYLVLNLVCSKFSELSYMHTKFSTAVHNILAHKSVVFQSFSYKLIIQSVLW